jgi:dTDP-4-amino-4,6-dideoxygalactose transaminase
VNAPQLGQRGNHIWLHSTAKSEDDRGAVLAALDEGCVAGGGPFGARVESDLRRRLSVPHALVTTSGTHALELAAMALDLGEGAEVVVPSFGHPSTANAFIRNGCSVKFADSAPDTPHPTAAMFERRISDRTAAICIMHYGGVAFDVSGIQELCRARRLLLIEDAAHALGAHWDGKPCGSLADAGCLSFHETKNVGCGEGGATLFRSSEVCQRALAIREMGTDRARFRAGSAPGYDWTCVGSSFIPSDLLMSLLLTRLKSAARVTSIRRKVFADYLASFAELERNGHVVLPSIAREAEVNGHVFYVATRDEPSAVNLIEFLEAAHIQSSPHFKSLSRSSYGQILSRDAAPTPNADRFARTLVRLPSHAQLTAEDQERVIASVHEFFCR